MTKVHITFTDAPDDEVTVKLEFDPVLKKGDSGTPAQHLAMQVLERAKEVTE